MCCSSQTNPWAALTNDFSPEKGTDSQPLIRESISTNHKQFAIMVPKSVKSYLLWLSTFPCVFLSFYYQGTTFTNEWNTEQLTSQVQLGMMMNSIETIN